MSPDQFDTESPEEKEALDRISDSVGKSPKKSDTFGANEESDLKTENSALRDQLDSARRDIAFYRKIAVDWENDARKLAEVLRWIVNERGYKAHFMTIRKRCEDALEAYEEKE